MVANERYTFAVFFALDGISASVRKINFLMISEQAPLLEHTSYSKQLMPHNFGVSATLLFWAFLLRLHQNVYNVEWATIWPEMVHTTILHLQGELWCYFYQFNIFWSWDGLLINIRIGRCLPLSVKCAVQIQQYQKKYGVAKLESIQGTCRRSLKRGWGHEQKPLMHCIIRFGYQYWLHIFRNVTSPKKCYLKIDMLDFCRSLESTLTVF